MAGTEIEETNQLLVKRADVKINRLKLLRQLKSYTVQSLQSEKRFNLANAMVIICSLVFSLVLAVQVPTRTRVWVLRAKNK